MLETKLRTKGIDHTVLHVKDVAKSRQCYLDVLGMTVNHEDATHAFLWCGGGQMVALFQVGEGTDIKPGDDMNHMALRIESGTYEEVRRTWKATAPPCSDVPAMTGASTSTTQTGTGSKSCIRTRKPRNLRMGKLGP